MKLLEEEGEEWAGTVVLEIEKGKIRCADGKPSTHMKLEIQKASLVTKPATQHQQFQFQSSSFFPLLPIDYLPIL